jgi:hypothetical protein
VQVIKAEKLCETCSNEVVYLGWEKVLCHDLQEPYTQCIGLSDPAPMTTISISDELVLIQLLNLVQ